MTKCEINALMGCDEVFVCSDKECIEYEWCEKRKNDIERRPGAKIKVTYVNHQGDDDFIVQTARITTESEGKQTRPLIRYLIRNDHFSPFEFCNITFDIDAPLFVMRQFFRHRTFKYAEKSMRYTKSDGSDLDFYHFDEMQGFDGVSNPINPITNSSYSHSYIFWR